MKRNTVQKTMIIQALHGLNHPSAENIYDLIVRDYPSISKATVYRHLASLSQEGEIVSVKTSTGEVHFDHTTSPHYHFQCNKCRGVFDIEIPYQSQLNTVQGANGFKIENHTLLFTGMCPHCHNT